MIRRTNEHFLTKVLLLTIVMIFLLSLRGLTADAATAAPKVDKSKIIYYSDDINRSNYIYVNVTLPSKNSKLYYKLDAEKKYRTSGTATWRDYYPKVKKVGQSGKKATLRIDVNKATWQMTVNIYLKASPNGKVKKVSIKRKKGLCLSSDYCKETSENKTALDDALLSNSTWESSDENIISIQDDKLIMRSPGTATITVKSGDHIFQRKVTVKDNNAEMKKVAEYIKVNGELSDDGRYYSVSDIGFFTDGSRMYSVDYYPYDDKVEFKVMQSRNQDISYKWKIHTLETLTATVTLNRNSSDSIPISYYCLRTEQYNGKLSVSTKEDIAMAEHPEETKGWVDVHDEYDGWTFPNLSKSDAKDANDLYRKARGDICSK